MNDEKKQSHWDDLAEDLGAQAPPESSAPASDPPKPRDVPPPRPRKSSPRKPPPPTDWSSLADGLGLSASVDDKAESIDDKAASVDDKAEEAAPTILLAEAVDTVVEEGAGDVSTAQTVTDGRPESDQAPAKKRRRRRRGRGRGRRADKREEGDDSDGERAESNEQDAGATIETGDVDTEVVEAAEPRQDDASGEDSGAVGENEEGEEKRRKPRRRRGRRRRSKTADADTPQTPTDEEDANLESAEVLTGYADGQDGAVDDIEIDDVDEAADDKGQPTRKASGGSQRQIPTWEEAIGVIVEVNMEAREKAGKGNSSAPRRGGRGRGRGGGRKR